MDFHTDNATEAWDEVLGRVEAFIAAWSDGPPSIRAFLKDEDPAPIRQLVLHELIKIDLEYRMERDEPVRVEHYLDQFPELTRDAAISGLIYEEYHLRRARGSDVGMDEYRHRFPDQSQIITKLLDVDGPTLSVSLRRAAPRIELETGQKFDDFDLLVKLGAGAFGAVFLARQISMQRLVALKVTADQGAEPQTLAKLDHPHIVRVFDQREAPEQSLWLMYMEFLPGGALDRVCKAQQGLPRESWTGELLLKCVDDALLHAGQAPVDTLRRQRLRRASWSEIVCLLGSELAQALAYAHANATLHRDIKPANVLLTVDASPKLADFNTSYCSKVEGATPTSYFGGSLPYMSPEQLEAFNPRHERAADSLEGRADVYSLGVMLWELLTGGKPFGREKLSGDITRDLQEMVERRRAGPPGAEAFEDQAVRTAARTLASCMDPDPRRRPRDGEELAERLRLGLNPRAMQIFQSADSPFARRIMRAPAISLLLMTLAPNLLAAALNWFYNRAAIIAELKNDVALQTFDRTQMIINGIAFPIGIAIVFWLCQPIRTAARFVREGQPERVDSWNAVARRALQIGHFAAFVGLALWGVAGLAYPISMHAALGHFPAGGYLHFASSLLFCGLIAASYPFFFSLGLAMRSVFPWCWSQCQSSREVWAPSPTIVASRRLSTMYLPVAAGAPLLALLCLAPLTLWLRNHWADKWALIALILAGGLGLAASLVLNRRLQDDWRALLDHHGSRDPIDT